MIVAYYTHDYKFESIWNDPRPFTARMLNFKVHAVVTPNFSPWAGCPFWYDLTQTARSRWLGRYWQEAGLNVIPDITLSNLTKDQKDFEQRLQMRLAGLPQELPCISIQLQQKGNKSTVDAIYAHRRVALLKMLEYIHPQQIILYHGPDLPPDWIERLIAKKGDIQVIPVKSWMQERTKVMREKEYMRT